MIGGRGCRAALLLLLLALPVGTDAQSTARYAAPWNGVEGRLVLEIPNATIRVQGTPGDSVHVLIRSVRDETVTLPTPRQLDGEVRLISPRNTATLEVVVRVPSRFEASIRGSNGGPVTVDGVHGALTVENSNAPVVITGARNAILASTSNASISAHLDALAPGAPLSFLTSNDSISVTLPGARVDADVFLETDNGMVQSDYPIAPDTAVRAIPTFGADRSRLRGRIGAGGPLIRIRTDNGNILIRRGDGG